MAKRMLCANTQYKDIHVEAFPWWISKIEIYILDKKMTFCCVYGKVLSYYFFNRCVDSINLVPEVFARHTLERSTLVCNDDVLPRFGVKSNNVDQGRGSECYRHTFTTITRPFHN